MTCSIDAKQHLASVLDFQKLHRNSLRSIPLLLATIMTSLIVTYNSYKTSIFNLQQLAREKPQKISQQLRKSIATIATQDLVSAQV